MDYARSGDSYYPVRAFPLRRQLVCTLGGLNAPKEDRKSTRLNSSHQIISYAVFCLKKNEVLMAFDALRAVEAEHHIPREARRHRIEHVQLALEEDLPRPAQLDLVAALRTRLCLAQPARRGGAPGFWVGCAGRAAQSVRGVACCRDAPRRRWGTRGGRLVSRAASDAGRGVARVHAGSGLCGRGGE